MRDVHGSTVRVLITRPRAQAAQLIDGVRRLGFEPVALSCLSIEPLPVPASPRPRHGVAIFTSRNAVEHATARDGWPWQGVPALAIGAATAEALAASGQPAALPPCEPFDTEALLARLDALVAAHGDSAGDGTGGDGGNDGNGDGGGSGDAAVAAVLAGLSRGVTIVTGEGGRPTLTEALRERGHDVQRRELYRRCATRPTEAELAAALQPLPDVVSASSDAVLDALVQIVVAARSGGQCLERLRGLPLLVNGERCAAYARSIGFSGPLLVARPAGDAGQLAALARWRTNA